MSTMENVFFNLTTEMTPKIDEKEVAFSLRSRDYKDPQCVIYRKKGHPQNAEQPQQWEQTEVSDTLNVFDNSETRTPVLIIAEKQIGGCCAGFKPEQSEQAHGVGYELEKSPTLTTGQVPGIVIMEKMDGKENNLHRQWTDSRCHDTEHGSQQDIELPRRYDENSYRGGQDVVALENHPADSRIKISGDVVQTLSSRMGTGGNNVPMAMETNDYVVRRLTPLECTRLQGYPDGWCDIGDWIDSKGKKHKDADSPKYKALGNSIGLPFWQWLMDRIVKQLKDDGVEHPTMASLFDGIGGFPLVSKRAGCEPLWASEIEEYPIAVTKKHFGSEDQPGDVEKYL